MADAAPIQHAPAMKVGRRRLSVSVKHKPQRHGQSTSPQSEDNDEKAPVLDYPRPVPPNDNAPPQHDHQHNEEPPKKERNEKKIQEQAARKAEMLRPTRDNFASKDHAAGIRISQPSKALDI